ncbi:MAG: hypothetical protein Q9171_005343 [Xanthocarpia ochracea]
MSVLSKAAPQPQGQRQGPKPQRLDSLTNPQPRRIPIDTPAKKQSDRISVCTDTNCGSTNLDEDNGYLVCQACGTIIQETNIVSDNTFIETGGGESMRAGVTVGNDASRARVYDPVGARIAGGMTSREVSEANGRHAIRAVAGHPLNIVQDLQDAAMQVYKLALANNFVQGRHTKSVAAVCLYIACRRSNENNKWMLIDFADKCDMNVFKLGMTFKALLKVLHVSPHFFQTLEPVNIEGLILRFAEQMQFGRAKQRIANEAARIVQRMSRDWMTEGRRPAGICGAALILAARMNNYRRAVMEVVYIVKVAEVTLFKRLDEFKATESGGLTVEQFRTIDLPGAADPPAFQKKDKTKKKQGKARQKGGKKRKAPVVEDDVDTEDASERADSAAISSRPKRGRTRKAPIEIDDDDTTDDESERPASALSSNVNAELPTPADTQAQRDRRSMPPPRVPIDPALLHVSNQRLAELQEGSSLPGSEPARSTRGRGRPPNKTQPPAEPSASDIQVEKELEIQIQEILGNENSIRNAEHAHKNPDAPGIVHLTQKEPALSTPPSTQSSSVPASIPQESSSSQIGSRSEAPASLGTIRAEERNRSQPRSTSPAQSSRSSASDHSGSNRSSSRSPSPPPKRRRTTRPNQLITSTSTTQPLLDMISSSEIVPEEEFADDVDVANCLLTSHESTIKERLWVHANSDYLRALQAKMLKQQLAEQNGTARKIVKRKRRRTRIGDLSGVYDERGPPKDAGEAVERMMKKRAFSKKINYQQIQDVYGGSRRSSEAPSTPGAQEGSRRQSVAPTTKLGPDGEILVDGAATPGSEVIEIDRAGDTRDDAIELEDVESDEDDYYNEDDDMAGVDEVVKDVVDGNEEEDEDEDG